jgi:hypothetical protein
LRLSAVLRALTDCGAVGTVHGATLLAGVEVLRAAVAVLNHRGRPLFQNALELFVREVDIAPLTGSTRNIAEELVHQIADLGPHLVEGERTRE